MLGPGGQAGSHQRLCDIEPPTVRHGSAPLGIVGQRSARPGIMAACIPMGCGQGLRDVGPGAEAGIDQSLRTQPVQRFRIGRYTLRLDDCIAVIGDAEPLQVLQNAIDKFRPASTGIQVLDPQKEASAAFARGRAADCRRIGMAEMQPARGRRGETCDLQDSLHGKGDSGDS